MEPMKVGFQAVLAPGYPCELLAGRLVPGHLLATLSGLRGPLLSSPCRGALQQTPPFCAGVALPIGVKCLHQPQKINLPHDDLFHALMD